MSKDPQSTEQPCPCGCHFSDFDYRGGKDCAMCGDNHATGKETTQPKAEKPLLTFDNSTEYERQLRDIVETIKGNNPNRYPTTQEAEILIETLIATERNKAVREELIELARKYWQLPIPELAILDRIKELGEAA